MIENCRQFRTFFLQSTRVGLLWTNLLYWQLYYKETFRMSLAFRNIPLSAIAFAAAMPLALVACGDDSSSSASDNEEQPTSSAIEEEQPGSSASNGAPVASLPDIPCADTLQIDGHYFGGTNVFYKCEDNKWSFVEEKDIPSDAEVPNIWVEREKAIWKLNKCTAANDGAVQSEWEGNPKYGGMYHFRCESGSWVQGDISLTCDTAGVQVGDTCVKQGSMNIFQAGINPVAEKISFVYKGDGVWERTDQAQIDSLAAAQNRRDAAMEEQCGEPDPEKDNKCCFRFSDEDVAVNPEFESALYEYGDNGWTVQAYYSNLDCIMDAVEEEIIED